MDMIVTIWLFNSSPWKITISKNSKPSISMGHLYHGKLLVITRWYMQFEMGLPADEANHNWQWSTVCTPTGRKRHREMRNALFSPGEMRCRVEELSRSVPLVKPFCSRSLGFGCDHPPVLRPFFQMADWWFMVSMYDDLAINKLCFPGKLLVLLEGITRTKRFCVVQQPHP